MSRVRRPVVRKATHRHRQVVADGGRPARSHDQVLTRVLPTEDHVIQLLRVGERAPARLLIATSQDVLRGSPLS
jgi:hypothetical protein